ncbi:MAG TPA: response regulator, partial [Oxalicibacterium sp.]
MPEMDGLTAASLIRSEARFDDLPILAMTAHAMSSDREKSMAAGMNDHITKPIDPDLLTQTLAYWLGDKPRQQCPEDESEMMAEPAVDSQGVPDELPPFDIPLALVLTNGKRTLLRRLILSFHERYNQAAATLRTLNEQQRYEDAERLAHTIKGVAATLGAEALRGAADAIELAYHGGNAEKAAMLFDPFEQELQIALAAAASLAAAPSDALPVNAQAHRKLTGGERSTIAAQLSTLRADIANNSLKARKSFVPVNEALRYCGFDAELEALESALEQLAFPTALECVDRLSVGLVGKE